MLCCVSRKASPRLNNNKKTNNDEARKESVLRHDSESSSGISSSSFDSSDRIDSSISYDLTTPSSSSSQNTSGFSSSVSIIRKFTDSSIDTFSIPSEFSSNHDDDAYNFLVTNSNFIHTVDPNSPEYQFPETPKRLQTFSTPAKHDDTVEATINVETNGKLDNHATDEPLELLPCAICARTFKPQSLEKHTKICERAAIKKRKPFDSAKQRIQGTELAEFLPKETSKRKVYQTEDKTNCNKGSWKQTHDEFLRAIRAARGETIEAPRVHQSPASNVTIGVPTRPNEKGMCPTCNRKFSIKSYERHVEWCKDRAAKVPMSAATNIAKERLEARMKYRAPALKNRRASVRDKYSPSSATHLASLTSQKINNGNSSNQRAKETVSTPNCHEKIGHENPTGNNQPQKSTANSRRTGQGREGITSGPMKSRLSDRSNRPSGENDLEPASDLSTSREASSRTSNTPIPRHCRNSPRPNIAKSSNASSRCFRKIWTDARDESEENIDEKSDEQSLKLRGINETLTRNRRPRQNIVQARSHGNPRINDITINDDVLGMTVQPCNRNKNSSREEEFVTWKKISQDTLRSNDFLKFHSVRAEKFIDESAISETFHSPDAIDEKSDFDAEKSGQFNRISWNSGIEKLDQTYSIRESLDGEIDLEDLMDRRKRRPVIDSPRNEFPRDSQVENQFFNHFYHRETSAELRHECAKESARKLEKSVIGPTFSTAPNLEPLNLGNIENGDEPEASCERSCRSEKSSLSMKKSSRRKSKKISPEMDLASGNWNGKSIDREFLEETNDKNAAKDPGSIKSISRHSDRGNMRFSNSLRSSRDAQSSRKSIAKEPSNEIVKKNDYDEHFQVAEASRSSKSTKSMNNSADELFTKKVIEMNESVDRNEFVARESLNFESCEEENPQKRRSGNILTEIDKQERSLEIPESPNANESQENDKEDSTRVVKRTDSKESFYHDSLNSTSRNDKNGEEPRGKNLPNKNRRKNDKNVSALRTSRSQINGQSPKLNCEDLLTKKLAQMHSIAKNLHIPVDDDRKKENSKKKGFSRDSEIDDDKNTSRSIDRTTGITNIEENNKTPETASCQTIKPKESPEKEIDKKNETKLDMKINYKRCKTYVIDKKSDGEKKHQAPQDFPDDKPQQKRRKIESFETEKVSEKSFEIDNKEDKIENNLNENSTSESEKCVKELENPNDSIVEAVENIPEFSEKYVNSKFNSDSDETLISEKISKDLQPEYATEKKENLNSLSDPSILDVPQKSFSDSYVPREQVSVETLLGTQEKPEIGNVREPLISTLKVQESLNQNFAKDSLTVAKELSGVELPEVEKSNDDTNLIDASFSDDEKTPEILSETSRKTREKLVDNTLPMINEKQRVKGCCERVREFGSKNTLEKSNRRNVEAPEVRNSDDRSEKSRTKNRVFPKVVESPEDKDSSRIRKKLREKMEMLRDETNDLIASVESSDEVLSNKNSLGNMESLEARSLGEIEEETIQEIIFEKFGDTYESKLGSCGFLPEIPIDRIAARNENSKNSKKFPPLDAASFAWQRSMKNSNVRLINLDPPKYHRETKIPCKRLPNVANFLPVIPFGKDRRSGSCAEYDPFLIAERQMNELLSDTCSEKSIITDLSSNRRRSSLSPTLPNYPLTHSSAFVKYGGDSPVVKIGKLPEKRVSLIAPPTEFDDFSSDSTETNSISREIKNGYNTNSRSRDACHENDEARRKNVGRDHVLGRRVIIDKSKALGIKDIYDDTASIRSLMENSSGNGKVRKLFEKKTSPKVNRSNSVRTNSSPKTNVKKINNSDNSPNDKLNNIQNHRNNNYPSLSGSNVSLSSIVSSDVDVKRSHSAFDELASSCDDDTSPIYPSLTYLLKNDSLSITSPVQSNRPRNGQISDEEFSSPDSYKRHHEHNKLSADSAYSSLNRKYSNHGRGTNEMAGRHEEDSPLHRRELEIVGSITRSKLSRFCHECGSKFPETAKFCCECGIKRLAL